MSLPPESREEALARLTESASALEARTAREVSQETAGHAAASEAWRIVADLLGGVFVGLALGAVVDWYFKTNPWGLIGGVLAGFAISIWMAWRTAQRIMAKAKASGVEPRSVPFDEDKED